MDKNALERVLQTLATFATEINGLLREGKSLRQISQWSYTRRQSEGYYPYLSILQTEGKGPKPKVVELAVSPVQWQKEIYELFSLTAPGWNSRQMFEFWVTEDGVDFYMITGKDPETGAAIKTRLLK